MNIKEASSEAISADPFRVRDCTLVAQATGIRAQNLRELRNGLMHAAPSSIYHHFWGRFLRAQFDEPEYNNDFASWVYHALNERALAERLSAVNPANFGDFASLRGELVEVIESRLDLDDHVPWARGDQQFQFIQSQIIVLETGFSLEDPLSMAAAMGVMAPGSIYYHFIDARRRTPGHDNDFSRWLTGFGAKWETAREALRAIDPYFSSLAELREGLTDVMHRFAKEN